MFGRSQPPTKSPPTGLFQGLVKIVLNVPLSWGGRPVKARSSYFRMLTSTRVSNALIFNGFGPHMPLALFLVVNSICLAGLIIAEKSEHIPMYAAVLTGLAVVMALVFSCLPRSSHKASSAGGSSWSISSSQKR
ncbi:uncharacterized protein BJ171DRAFT_598100 [Polychytrium aggregatum]|uniref:uncharacterized protein n=1 Tax=Polychytrium aggregatum TaxID=110093 RepID=UPI0022FF1B1E|nr:uncharacterized protein BJ171DRAFT_598100 [Polychytrium aggregatum]KAI9205913.1 hypothetical protein BJ171DRAFT_598100 [Polychytrium aggregatum]